MNFCPNLKNKATNQEFKELSSVLGEDLAYLLWDKTGGNGVIFDENGKRTKKYSEILERANGNKQQAILAIAETIINGTPDTTLKTGIYLDYYMSQKAFVDRFKPVVTFKSRKLRGKTYGKSFDGDMSGGYAAIRVLGEDISHYFPKNFFESLPTIEEYTNKIEQILNEHYFKDLPINKLRNRLSGYNFGMSWIHANNLINSLRQVYAGNITFNDIAKEDRRILNEWKSKYSESLIKSILSSNKYLDKKTHRYVSYTAQQFIEEIQKIKKHMDLPMLGLRAKYKTYLRLSLEHFTNPDLSKQIALKIANELYRNSYFKQKDYEKDIYKFGESSSLLEALPKLGDKKKLSEILPIISQEFPQYKPLCDVLLNIKSDIFVLSSSLFMSQFGFMSQLGVHIHTEKDGKLYAKIAISPENIHSQADLARVILHEAVHAATVNYLELHPSDRQKIKAIIDVLQQKLGHQYAFTDEKEFVAEFFSNLDFQYLLMELKPLDELIPSYTTESEIKRTIYNAWGWFKGLILKALNVKQSSVYDQLYEYMDEILSAGVSLSAQIEYLSADVESEVDNEGLTIKREFLKRKIKNKEQIQKKVETLYNRVCRKHTKDDTYRQDMNDLFELQAKLKSENFAELALDFLEYSSDKLKSIKNKLEQQFKDDFKDLTSSDIVDIYETLISPTNDIFRQGDIMSAVDYIIDDKIKTQYQNRYNIVHNMLEEVIVLWKEAVCKISLGIIDEIVDQAAVREEDKEGMKQVSYDWLLHNFMNDDMGAISAMLYNYSNMPNQVIRQMFHKLNIVQAKVYRDSTEHQNRVVTLIKHLKRYGIKPEDLVEIDSETGIPTGYFISKYNKGLYTKAITEEVKKLDEEFEKKYGFCYKLKNGEWVMTKKITGPDGVTEHDFRKNETPDFGDTWTYITTGSNSNFKCLGTPPLVEYLQKIEQIKCRYSERRYTELYYTERLSEPYDPIYNPTGHGLSPETLFKYQEIQSNINHYLDLATDNDGMCRPEKLTDVEKALLNYWKQRLRDLLNPYQYTTDDNGLKRVSQKPYDEYKLAMEILAWQLFVADHTSKEYDMHRWKMFLIDIQDKEGYAAFEEFLSYNGEFRINPDYFEFACRSAAEDMIRQNPNTLGQYSAYELAEIIKSGKKRSIEDSVNKALSSFGNGDLFGVTEIAKHALDLNYFMLMRRLYLDSKTAPIKILGVPIGPYIGNYFTRTPYMYKDMAGRKYKINHQQSSIIPLIWVDTENTPDDAATPDQFCTVFLYLCITVAHAIVTADPSVSGYLKTLTNEEGDELDIIAEARSYAGSNKFTDEEAVYLYLRDNVYGYEDGYGNNIMLPVFSYREPGMKKFQNGFITESTMTFVPTNNAFIKKSNEFGAIPWFNNNYDLTSTQKEQPKELFINEKYDNIAGNPVTYLCYNQLIDLMKQAWDIYFPGQEYDYRLPQIESEFSSILSRIKTRGIKDTFRYALAELIEAQAKDNLVRRRKDTVKNPDGSVFSEVGPKYVGMLEDPSQISLDLTHTVSLFLLAATDFKYKSEILDDLKTIRYAMDDSVRNYVALGEEDAPEQVNNKRSRDTYDTMIRTHLAGVTYEDQLPILDNDNKNAPAKAVFTTIASSIGLGVFNMPLAAIASYVFDIGLATSVYTGIGLGVAAGIGLGTAIYKMQKTMNNSAGYYKLSTAVLSLTALQMLGFNIGSAAIGFGGSVLMTIKEALSGCGINYKNLAVASGRVLKNLPYMFVNMKDMIPNNKVGWLMAKSNLSVDFSDRTKKSNRWRVWKLLKAFPMSFFSMGDYLNTSVLLLSKYNNIRLLTNDNPILQSLGITIKEGFYDKFQTLNMLQDSGLTKKEAIAAYNATSIDLYDAHDKFGDIRPEFEQYVNEETIAKTYSYPHYRSALMNGMLPTNDDAPWKSNLIMRWIMLLRGFMLVNWQNAWAGENDNIPRRIIKSTHTKYRGMRKNTQAGYKKDAYTNEEKERMFGYNYEFGNLLPLLWKGIISSFSAIAGNCLPFLFKSHKRKLSTQERNSIRRLLIILSCLFIQGVCWNKLDNHLNQIQEALPSIPVKEKAGVYSPTNYFSLKSWMDYAINHEFSERDLTARACDISYGIMAADAGAFTMIDAESVLTNVTAVQSQIDMLKEAASSVNQLSLPGQQDLSRAEDLVTTGKYEGHRRIDRMVGKTIGMFGNIIGNATYSGINSRYQWKRKNNLSLPIVSPEWYANKKTPKPKQEKTIKDTTGFGDSGFGDSGFGGDSGF